MSEAVLYCKYDSIQKNPFQAPWGDKIFAVYAKIYIKRTAKKRTI